MRGIIVLTVGRGLPAPRMESMPAIGSRVLGLCWTVTMESIETSWCNRIRKEDYRSSV